jgi:nitrous oxidase accessory protein
MILSVPDFICAAPRTDVTALLDAVNNGTAGDTIEIAAGTFEIPRSLQPKRGMTIKGAGAEKTILIATPSWDPDTTTLPDNATKSSSMDGSAYLFDLRSSIHSVTIADMTLDGARNLHGVLCGNNCDTLEMYNLIIRNVIWSSIRTFRMGYAKIHDNEFIDAGGRVKHSGGALYQTWVEHSEFWNNRIMATDRHSSGHFYGFKGRQGNYCRFHHNTVLVNFSLEYPFENDREVEIDHNYFTGVISIPKFAGGNANTGSYSFHIHHNYLTSSYAIEYTRNGAKIDHNLFDFNVSSDGGNLISSFGSEPAEGPTIFHDNLIKNPGRGILWSRGIYNNFAFYNNHIIANTTKTPRKDGLFGLNTGTDFSTIEIRDNILECNDTPRPLMRNDESYGAVIENNTLVAVSDSAQFENPSTDAARGPTEPHHFHVGVNDEYLVDGWDITKDNNSSGTQHEYTSKTNVPVRGAASSTAGSELFMCNGRKIGISTGTSRKHILLPASGLVILGSGNCDHTTRPAGGTVQSGALTPIRQRKETR